jgi:hypothetical protein
LLKSALPPEWSIFLATRGIKYWDFGFYRLWARFGLVTNAVVSRIILGVVYYVIVLPAGLGTRIRGKDPMRRTAKMKTNTYRVTSRSNKPDQMRKPF